LGLGVSFPFPFSASYSQSNYKLIYSSEENFLTQENPLQLSFDYFESDVKYVRTIIIPKENAPSVKKSATHPRESIVKSPAQSRTLCDTPPFLGGKRYTE
jgi:hypothetical protein